MTYRKAVDRKQFFRELLMTMWARKTIADKVVSKFIFKKFLEGFVKITLNITDLFR
jgi:hypothetical protein